VKDKDTEQSNTSLRISQLGTLGRNTQKQQRTKLDQDEGDMQHVCENENYIQNVGRKISKGNVGDKHRRRTIKLKWY